MSVVFVEFSVCVFRLTMCYTMLREIESKYRGIVYTV